MTANSREKLMKAAIKIVNILKENSLTVSEAYSALGSARDMIGDCKIDNEPVADWVEPAFNKVRSQK